MSVKVRSVLRLTARRLQFYTNNSGQRRLALVAAGGCNFYANLSSSNKMADNKYSVFVTRSDMPSVGIELLKKRCDVSLWSEASTVPRDILLQNVVGINALYCTLSDKIDVELLDKAPDLKVVATISVGHDHIDLKECKRRGIKVGYTPDVLTDATAELTMGLLLCTSRRLLEAHKEAVIGHWTAWAPNWMTGPGLAGAVVGIVGFGRIGQAVAHRVKSFNPKQILYYNRTDRTDIARLCGAERETNLYKIASDCDFVICCCALTDDTFGMFNMDFFSKMKKTAVFINTSRGGLVDQDALIEALQNGEIRAAGLDVTNPEPLPTDNILYKLPNCVILPHIGSASIEARATMSKLTAENIIAGLNGDNMPAELV